MSYQRDVKRAVTSVVCDYDKYRKSMRMLKSGLLSQLFLLLILVLSSAIFGACLSGMAAQTPLFAISPTADPIEVQKFNGIMCGLTLALFGFSLYGLITGHIDTTRMRDEIKERYPTWDSKPEIDDPNDL